MRLQRLQVLGEKFLYEKEKEGSCANWKRSEGIPGHKKTDHFDIGAVRKVVIKRFFKEGKGVGAGRRGKTPIPLFSPISGGRGVMWASSEKKGQEVRRPLERNSNLKKKGPLPGEKRVFFKKESRGEEGWLGVKGARECVRKELLLYSS